MRATELESFIQQRYRQLDVFTGDGDFQRNIWVRFNDPATGREHPPIEFEALKWKESDLRREVLAVIEEWLAKGRTE